MTTSGRAASATISTSRQDECVMARHGSVLVAAFHPELTDESTVHGYFAGMVRASLG